MRILGCDPSSSKIGLCLLEGDDVRYTTVKVEPAKAGRGFPPRVNKAAGECASWVGVTPDLVAIEAPFQKWARATTAISWVAGVLARTFGVTEVRTVANKAWKRAATGNGNASKEQVMRCLQAQGYRPPDEHTASALGVALFAQSRYGGQR